MSKKNNFRDAVWSLFKSRAGEWIDGREIASVGGAYAWRTRLSECRRFYGVTIQNRIVRIAGSSARSSQYRYLPTGRLEVAS